MRSKNLDDWYRIKQSQQKNVEKKSFNQANRSSPLKSYEVCNTLLQVERNDSDLTSLDKISSYIFICYSDGKLYLTDFTKYSLITELQLLFYISSILHTHACHFFLILLPNGT